MDYQQERSAFITFLEGLGRNPSRYAEHCEAHDICVSAGQSENGEWQRRRVNKEIRHLLRNIGLRRD